MNGGIIIGTTSREAAFFVNATDPLDGHVSIWITTKGDEDTAKFTLTQTEASKLGYLLVRAGNVVPHKSTSQKRKK